MPSIPDKIYSLYKNTTGVVDSFNIMRMLALINLTRWICPGIKSKLSKKYQLIHKPSCCRAYCSPIMIRTSEVNEERLSEFDGRPSVVHIIISPKRQSSHVHDQQLRANSN